MPLPNINETMEYETYLKGLGRNVRYRPFLVQEQKILLHAAESGEVAQIASAIRQIFDNCMLDGTTAVEMPAFDFEHLFIKLRSVSISDAVVVLVGHGSEENTECEHQTELKINLNDIDLSKEPPSQLIELNESYGLKLKYPSVSELPDNMSDFDASVELIANNMDCIYELNNDGVWPAGNLDENKEWIYKLTDDQLKKIRNFFRDQPTVALNLDVTCEMCGSTRPLRLRGLNDFFI